MLGPNNAATIGAEFVRFRGRLRVSAGPALRLHEGDDHYHEHDDYALDFDPELDGLWQADNVKLISVGIDIGSSGTQVIFSRIHMQRLGDELSSRFCVVAREQLYESPVSLTPYAPDLRIDGVKLGGIIDEAYQAANLRPAQVDTGAVILTGEALRRENARQIADILAARGGNFVCTMAGHHIEAMLAGYGSGAAWVSNELGAPVLNIDIGGGTTKLALLEQGRVVATAAVDIGGRLHVFDAARRLTRLEPSGVRLAQAAGYAWQLGDQVSETEIGKVADWMADAVLAAVTQPEAAPIAQLFLTEKLPSLEGIAAVMFSGGVSEYVYGRESRDFGDMGRLFGTRLAARLAAGALPWKQLPAGSGIRATALGLSEYSVQLSGNTIYVSDPETLLPCRNLRVVEPDLTLPQEVDAGAVGAAIAAVLGKLEESEQDAIALALRWQGEPAYRRIRALAEGIIQGLKGRASGTAPVYMLLDGDIARSLGMVLRDELGMRAPLLLIDGIVPSAFDYVDFGRLKQPSNTVPVTIKSLLFARDPRMSVPAMPGHA
jgi:ethanolamine utilization protein EutA